MYVLCNFDWFGDEEGLKEIDTLWADTAKKAKGVTFKGRFAPYGLNYHYTMIAEVKDLKAWQDFSTSMVYKRDFKTLPHLIYEFYDGKLN